MVSRSLAISSSRSTRPRRVSRPSVHVEDVLGLHLGELERLGHERRRGPRGRSSDARMAAMISSIMSSGLEQALDDVGPVLGLVEPELATGGG